MIDPDATDLDALTRIEAGPGAVTRDEVVRCHDPDVDDVGVGCGAWVPVPASGDEDEALSDELEGRVRCPRCDRAIRPLFERRARHRRCIVTLPSERVDAWLNALVRDAFPDARRLRGECAWWLDEDASTALVWLDGAQHGRAATVAFATSHAVIYVLTDSAPWTARLRDRPGVPWIAVADMLEGGVPALREAAKRAAPLPPSTTAAESRPWAAIRAPTPGVLVDLRGAHLLELRDEGVRLDGVLVLPADSALTATLAFFVQRWREDIGAGKAPDDHCTFRAEEIAEEHGGAAGRIHRQLSRLRASLRDAYHAATGRTVGEDDVIESVGRQGYRLRPGTAVLWR